MAIDVGIGDLLGSLFLGGGAEAGADVGAAAAADLGGAAAADLGAGAAADLGAAGADLAGATAADAGTVAADVAGGAGAAGAGDLGAGIGTDLAASVPGDLAAGALGDLGEPIGAADALSLAPTDAGAAADTAGIGAAGSLPGTTTGIAQAPGAAQAAASTPVGDLSTELAGANPNTQALLDAGGGAGGNPADATGFTGVSGPSTTQVAGAANPAAELSTMEGLSSQAAGPTGVANISSIDPNAAAALNGAQSPGVLSDLTSGAKGILSNPLTQLGELALPAGLIGYNLIRGPQPIPPQAQEAVQRAEAQDPALAQEANQNVSLYNSTASQDLNLANNFEISPQQAAALQTETQNQYNALIQQIENEQPGVDYRQTSQWVQGKNQIDQQALAQQVQMINQLISTAFQASSAANAGVSTASNVDAALNNTLMAAAQLQVQQDANFQQAVGSAMQAFGLIAGLQGTKLVGANSNNPAAAVAAGQ